jgi:hypothetical protein
MTWIFYLYLYHRKDDVVEIAKVLYLYDFEYEQTDRYLYFEGQFRTAIIRKKNKYNEHL